MKARKYIGGTVAIIGLMLAVCTADGSAYELALRCIGAAMLAIGAHVAQVFSFQNPRQ